MKSSLMFCVFGGKQKESNYECWNLDNATMSNLLVWMRHWKRKYIFLAILPQCQHSVALLQMGYNKWSWLSDKKFYLCCIIQTLSLFGKYAHTTGHLVSVNSSLSSNLILPMNQRIWHFLTTWLRDRQNFYLLGNGSYMVKTWSFKINIACMPLK